MVDKISIIIPCYNIEQFIVDTVKSIQSQTYRNIEIILVDDGSKDNTSRLLDQLAETDERIRVVHQENAGVTNARLNGVRIATGQWIGFVDGDDQIESTMFEHLLNNAEEHKADISHCGYQMVYPSKVVYYYNTGRLVEQDNKQGLYDLIAGTFVEPALWNKLYKKSLFEQLLQKNLMNNSIKNMEDLLMNFYLFADAKKSIYEDFCPYLYTLRKGSAATSAVNKNKLCDPVKVLMIIEKNVAEDYDLLQLTQKRVLSKLLSLATLYDHKNRELILPIRKEARSELIRRFPASMKQAFSVKLKLRMMWAIVFPYSYDLAHKLVAHIKGTDKKYEVK